MAKKKKAPNRNATRAAAATRKVSPGAILIRHKAVQEADQEAARVRSARDTLIRQAIEQGQSVRSVALLLGLSRQAIMEIRDQGKPKTPPPGTAPLF